MKLAEAVAELNPLDDLGQAVPAVEFAPFLLRRHHQLERHGQTGLAAEASLGAFRALGIGLAQACAILPGISRSGSTIGAALMLGVSREEAARFSFLMSLIPIGGATLLTLKDLMEAPAQAATGPWTGYIVGTLAAFVSGWIACTWMIRLVKRSNLAGFGAYCLAAGILALIFG